MSKPVYYRIFQTLEVVREKRKGTGATIKLLVNDECAERIMDIMMTGNKDGLGACVVIAKSGTQLYRPEKKKTKGALDEH
jgi:hypothetical protein